MSVRVHPTAGIGIVIVTHNRAGAAVTCRDVFACAIVGSPVTFHNGKATGAVRPGVAIQNCALFCPVHSIFHKLRVHGQGGETLLGPLLVDKPKNFVGFIVIPGSVSLYGHDRVGGGGYGGGGCGGDGYGVGR